MTSQLALVLALLAASIAMFVMNRPRMDAVGLIMLTGLPLTGIITASEALAGFSDPNIVLLAALFVIGEALVRTGVAQRIGDWLIRTAGSSSTRAACPADGRGERARRIHELDRRRRHLHPDHAADRPEHRHGSRAAS